MRLIKKFQDYYDSAVGYSIDPNIVYVRESKFIPLDRNEWQETFSKLVGHYRGSTDWNITYHIIGFCGVLYPLVHVEFSYYKPRAVIETTEEHIFYTFGDYKAWRQDGDSKWASREVQEFFEQFSGKRMDEKFVELEAPVFVVQRDPDDTSYQRELGILTNPCLKDWNFFRIKDAYTAFQEISMYLGNQLVQEKKVDEIADKYRIAGHGFDKQSFRNPIRLKDLK